MRGPQPAAFMRMPPGDRGPRLRFLAQRHHDALACLDASDPQAQRHAKAIARIEHVARVVGVGSLAKL